MLTKYKSNYLYFCSKSAHSQVAFRLFTIVLYCDSY